MKKIIYKKTGRWIKRSLKPFRKIWPKNKDAMIGVISLGIILLCFLTYSPTISQKASTLVNGNKYLAFLDGLFNPFRTRHLLLHSNLPIYELKIKHQQFAIIENAVEEARRQGWMSDDLKQWANARFIYNGQQYNVKVRIRGDLSPHWSGPKKSWRIKFGKEKIEYDGQVTEEPIYFEGKRQINLIIPSDRDYILSYFVNSLMKQFGLTTPGDKFVVLRINGTIQGLYYEVEHFDKSLLAAHERPETTIFGQNDRAMHFEQYTKLGAPEAADAKYDIGSMRRLVDEEGALASRSMQVLLDHALNPTSENFKRARSLLQWDKFLAFRAITTICNTNHVRFGSDNLRLYYDSSRGLFEPVPWDVHLVRMPKEPGTIDFFNNHGTDEIQHAILQDAQLRLERNKVLWKMVGDGGDSLIDKYLKIHNKFRPLVWADVLRTPVQGYNMDQLKKIFIYNVRRTYKVLDQSNANATYRLESNDRASLEFTTLNFCGIKVRQIELADSANFTGEYSLYQDSNKNGRLDDADLFVQSSPARNGAVHFDPDNDILPDVRYENDIIEGRYWEFYNTYAGRCRFFITGKMASPNRQPLEFTAPQITIMAQNAVSEKEIPSAFVSQGEPLPPNYMGISAFDCSDPFDLEAPEYTMAEFLAKNPEFKKHPTRQDAVLLAGSVIINRTIIVPKSVLLFIKPGADITLKPGSNILCYGGLLSLGTVEQPISFHGQEDHKMWGSVAVVRPKEKVIVHHTTFQDGGQAEINGILFTGGFAVHDGDLELIDCQFTDMQSEDGVNLKNGFIEMKNCIFRNSSSDGIDIDFGNGIVSDCQFVNTTGDGLDLSGSRITIQNCTFEGMGDKGISVGEDSHPLIVNNVFRNCVIGVSSKDLSNPKVAYCTFFENDLAIEVKRKKAMFGGGYGEVVNCIFAGNKELLQQDYFSHGNIKISHSLVDAEVDWPDCKKIDEFPGAENVLPIQPASITVDKDRFRLAEPEWLAPFSIQRDHAGALVYAGRLSPGSF